VLGTGAARRQGRTRRNFCGGSGRSWAVQVFPCDKTCHAEKGEEKVWQEFAEHDGARELESAGTEEDAVAVVNVDCMAVAAGHSEWEEELQGYRAVDEIGETDAPESGAVGEHDTGSEDAYIDARAGG